MADAAPESVNDDRVRTWTISSAHEKQDIAWFELTMREMKGGTVTGALFDLLRRNSLVQSSQPIAFESPISVDIVGITGDFSMSRDKLNVLWVAGGIGITPFLAILKALAESGPAVEGDIMLVVATREPKVTLDLMRPVTAHI